MTPVDFRPDPDEPPVHDPRLRLFVDAARSAPVHAVQVQPHAVFEGWQQRRSVRRRVVAVGLVMAAAMLLTVGLLGTSPSTTPAGETDVAVSEAPAVPGVTTLPTAQDVEPERTPVLSASVHVSPLEDTAGTVQVLGPRALRLPDGRWSIDSESTEPVEVELPDGTLQLRGGSVLVRVAGDVAHVEVLREQALRVDAEGRWVTMPVQSSATEEPAEPPIEKGPSSAAELARQAEAAMAAGDRQGAIRVLRRLVSRHPRSAAAQAGLIDLGRLLRAAGLTDEARCAYGVFLERWPGHALAGDVTRARSALGAGPACDGLRPQR